MTKSNLTIREFIKLVPKMRVFQLSMAAVLLGLTVSAWFLVQVMDAPISRLLFSMFFALIIAIPVLLHLCYQVYTGRLPAFFTEEDRDYHRAKATREIVSIVPLLLGAFGGFYFLMTSQFHYATMVFVPSLALWALLRYLTRRTRSSKKDDR